MSIRSVPAILHFVALSILIYGYNKMVNRQTPTDSWIRSQNGQYWQFLTVQALLAAILTMALSVLADVLPKNQVIIRAKRLMAMMSLPLSVVVSTIYWSLTLLAPSLILPIKVGSTFDLAFMPLDLDIMLHLLPVFFLTTDFYLLEEKYVQKDVRFYAPGMTIVFTVWYSGWIEYLAVFNHRFPYPFLEHPFPNRVMIYCAAATLGYVSFRQLNSWHPEKPTFGNIRLEKKS